MQAFPNLAFAAFTTPQGRMGRFKGAGSLCDQPSRGLLIAFRTRARETKSDDNLFERHLDDFESDGL
jgi:hypothetical protein